MELISNYKRSVLKYKNEDGVITRIDIPDEVEDPKITIKKDKIVKKILTIPEVIFYSLLLLFR